MPPKRPRPLYDAVSSARSAKPPAAVVPAGPADSEELFGDAEMALAVLRQGWVGDVAVRVPSATGVALAVQRVAPFPVFLPTQIYALIGSDGPVVTRTSAELAALESRGSLLLCAAPLPPPCNVVVVRTTDLLRFCSERSETPACPVDLRAGLRVVLRALEMRAANAAASAGTAALRPCELPASLLEAARADLLRSAMAARAAARSSPAPELPFANAAAAPAASAALALPLPPLESLTGPLLRLGLLAQLPTAAAGRGEGAAAMRAALAGGAAATGAGSLQAAAGAAESGCFVLGVPEAGRLWAQATDGRRELLQALARRPYGDMPRAAALSLRLARSRLPPAFHVRDAVGAGLAAEVRVPEGGTLLRLLPAGAEAVPRRAGAGRR